MGPLNPRREDSHCKSFGLVVLFRKFAIRWSDLRFIRMNLPLRQGLVGDLTWNWRACPPHYMIDVKHQGTEFFHIFPHRASMLQFLEWVSCNPCSLASKELILQFFLQNFPSFNLRTASISIILHPSSPPEFGIPGEIHAGDSGPFLPLEHELPWSSISQRLLAYLAFRVPLNYFGSGTAESRASVQSPSHLPPIFYLGSSQGGYAIQHTFFRRNWHLRLRI